VELLGDLVLGATAWDSGDDRLPTKSLPVILRLMATSGESGFSVEDTAERSGSGGTRLIGIRWHLAGYFVPGPNETILVAGVGLQHAG
jgi:hypothetical protein